MEEMSIPTYIGAKRSAGTYSSRKGFSFVLMRTVNRRSTDLQGSRYVPYGLLSKFVRRSPLLYPPKGKIQKASFSYFRIIP